VIRWELRGACFEAFLAVATIHIWSYRLRGDSFGGYRIVQQS
jgi:hypothetical protein